MAQVDDLTSHAAMPHHHAIWGIAGAQTLTA